MLPAKGENCFVNRIGRSNRFWRFRMAISFGRCKQCYGFVGQGLHLYLKPPSMPNNLDEAGSLQQIEPDRIVAWSVPFISLLNPANVVLSTRCFRLKL